MSSYPPWQTKVRVSAVVDYKKKKTLVKKGVFLFKASFLPPGNCQNYSKNRNDFLT